MLRAGLGRDGLGRNRQFNDELGADGLVLLNSNGTVMVLNDATDDGQSETGTAFLG